MNKWKSHYLLTRVRFWNRWHAVFTQRR